MINSWSLQCGYSNNKLNLLGNEMWKSRPKWAIANELERSQNIEKTIFPNFLINIYFIKISNDNITYYTHSHILTSIWSDYYDAQLQVMTWCDSWMNKLMIQWIRLQKITWNYTKICSCAIWCDFCIFLLFISTY